MLSEFNKEKKVNKSFGITVNAWNWYGVKFTSIVNFWSFAVYFNICNWMNSYNNLL